MKIKRVVAFLAFLLALLWIGSFLWPSISLLLLKSTSVNGLLGQIKNSDLNRLKFVEIHEEYALVELNGKRSVILPDSRYIENEVTVYGLSGIAPNFQALHLFDVSNWNLQKIMHPGLEYVVLRDYQTGMPVSSAVDMAKESSALRLVLIPVEEMPKVVDPKTWEGKESEFWIWEYPRMFPWVIQNANTGEIALFTGSVVKSHKGNEESLESGTPCEGTSSIVEDGDRQTILITY